jgi:tripartite-type tricarboxylate transporter receptor subunit TctC
MDRRDFNRLAFGAAAACTVGVARAQFDKPLSLVVGYSAGGSADFTARVVGEALAKRLGRPVVVENVAGASGMLAVQKVLNGPSDGSMVYMAGTDTVAVPLVNARIKHNWAKDFAMVGRMTTVPMIFAVPADSPYNSLAELMADLRKKGNDGFSYATPGVGTMQHFYGALINKHGHVQMLHIPYKGGSQIANDLVGHQVHSAVLVLSTALPFLKDGKIKAISISDNTRVPQLPKVKALGDEEGFKGISLPLWQGLMVKAGTPAAVVAGYEKALLDVLAQPEVKQRLADGGTTAAPMTGEQLRAFVAPQAQLYRDIVSSAKITVE